jgi:hypothetical protein
MCSFVTGVRPLLHRLSAEESQAGIILTCSSANRSRFKVGAVCSASLNVKAGPHNSPAVRVWARSWWSSRLLVACDTCKRARTRWTRSSPLPQSTPCPASRPQASGTRWHRSPTTTPQVSRACVPSSCPDGCAPLSEMWAWNSHLWAPGAIDTRRKESAGGRLPAVRLRGQLAAEDPVQAVSGCQTSS